MDERTLPNNWRPRLSGADHTTDEAIRIAFDNLFYLRDRLDEIAVSIPAPAPTMNEIQSALQVGGSSSLNVTGLPGVLSQVQAAAFSVTHAIRLTYSPADYVNATLIETDRNNLIYHSDGVTWNYVSGTYSRTQAQLAALLATLTVSDTGLLVFVSDFYHVLQFNGTVFTWGPGETGAHEIAGMPVAPSFGYALCDGSATTYLNSDGTVTAFTTPNLIGHYLKFNNAAYTPIAVASGASGATGAGTPAGTVSQPTFTGTALGNHQHELPMQLFSAYVTRFLDPAVFGTGASRAAACEAATGPSTSAAVVALSSAVSAGTPAGTVSQPTFSGTALSTHTHAPGTLELLRTELLPYFRR